jgi:hypothetical protein
MDRFLTSMTGMLDTERKVRLGAALIALVILALAPAPLRAANLSMGRLITEGDRRYLELAVTSYQGADILEAVRRGIEAKVSITMQLVKESALDYIYSRVVYSKTVRRSLRWDYWNRSFVITEAGKKTQYHNENAMFAHLFRVSQSEIPGRALAPGGSYLVRARAELKSVELYFPMNYIFKYIVGYWDFDTGWVYGPGVSPVR